MVNSCKTKAIGCKSCMSETSDSHLSIVIVWTLELAGNSRMPYNQYRHGQPGKETMFTESCSH